MTTLINLFFFVAITILYIVIVWDYESYVSWDFAKWIEREIVSNPVWGGMYIAVMDNNYEVLVLFEIPPHCLRKEGDRFWVTEDVKAIANASGKVSCQAFLDTNLKILGIADRRQWSMFDTIVAGDEYTIGKAR